MARVTRVQAARKGQTCGNCGAAIAPGDPYVWWAFRYGGKRVRCAKEACQPKPWDLEPNSKRAALLEAAARLDAARSADDPESAAESLGDAISLVEGAVEEFQAALDGWSGAGAGFDQSEQYQNFEAVRAELEDWLSDAESVRDDLEAIDIEPQAAEEGEEVDDAWRETVENLADVPEADF